MFKVQSGEFDVWVRLEKKRKWSGYQFSLNIMRSIPVFLLMYGVHIIVLVGVVITEGLLHEYVAIVVVVRDKAATCVVQVGRCRCGTDRSWHLLYDRYLVRHIHGFFMYTRLFKHKFRAIMLKLKHQVVNKLREIKALSVLNLNTVAYWFNRKFLI